MSEIVVQETRPLSAEILHRPWPADVLVSALQKQAAVAEKRNLHADEGLFGACLGILGRAGDRAEFLKAVFGVGSARDLTPYQRRALTDWIRPFKADTGEWVPNDPIVFQAEFDAVVTAEEG